MNSSCYWYNKLLLKLGLHYKIAAFLQNKFGRALVSNANNAEDTLINEVEERG